MDHRLPWVCWRDRTHRTETHPVLGWPRCADCGAGPAYHARPHYLPAALRLPVYVPVPGAVWAETMLAAGSALVGMPGSGERVTVYYEGWVHGAAQYADRDAHGKWEAGVEHAAGRLVVDYPTSATLSVPVDQVVQVGHHDPRAHRTEVTSPDALDAWIARREDWW